MTMAAKTDNSRRVPTIKNPLKCIPYLILITELTCDKFVHLYIGTFVVREFTMAVASVLESEMARLAISEPVSTDTSNEVSDCQRLHLRENEYSDIPVAFPRRCTTLSSKHYSMA
tara:strand:+ start:515 stop:859 length:345 start_codon:yes stop_codon:yes gene_type:complete